MPAKRYFEFVQQLLVMVILSAVVLLLTWPRLHPATNDEAEPLSALPATAMIAGAGEGGFAKLRISTADDLQLSSAYLLINGDRAGDFSQGELVIRAARGDVLQLDGSCYARPIRFTVEALSGSIDSSYLIAEPMTDSNVALAGTVVLRHSYADE